MTSSFVEVQSLAELADYHNDVADSLNSFYFSLFGHGTTRFAGYSPAELQLALDERILETEFRSSLAIFALIEAMLRVDFRLRVKLRRKDSLSKAFRVLYRNPGWKVRLEDLLDLWIEHDPTAKQPLQQLKSALLFRHWLAHGRYWRRPSHGQFDYSTIYGLGRAILKKLPLIQQA
jgi:hypothetical protein